MPEARVIPLRPDDDEPYVPPAAPPGWEEQLAGGLEFLRRRMTGSTRPTSSGSTPTSPTTCCCRCCGRCTRSGSGSRARGWRTSRRRVAPSWWPTTPAPSRPMR
ncbi:hypothetical protein [Blastococcus brunescens]|uniref:Uncharacterized protein n=1 Tax=Blastococcus brunescens TaxID=1564165 RepID=A0ABZ1AXA1_9ACTN|nr:hypothetical protein [Blastococcus sp. BMG 8361]WRL63180.1 hypothetical protein U6N30_25845 [Blastococcus sp. BMG 8361]